MNEHAVGFLKIKALDSEQRTIEGWATRPETDRVGDVVESKGAVYTLPIPLLMDHDHSSAVGEVFSATVSNVGIRFKAKIATIAEPGPIKDLCDSAWSAAKAGLRRAVSIGFRALDAEPLPNGGMHFKQWEWFELSMVSVPALASATIDQVKALDRNLRVKQGTGRVVKLDNATPSRPVVRLDQPSNPDVPGPVSRALVKSFDAVMDDVQTYERIKRMGSKSYAKRMQEADRDEATDEMMRDLKTYELIKEVGQSSYAQAMHDADIARAIDAELAAISRRLGALEGRHD